jgi:hypothetical protein
MKRCRSASKALGGLILFAAASVAAIAAPASGDQSGNVAGHAVLSLGYSTYLGGHAYETPIDMAVDQAGHAYILGLTRSSDFPLVTEDNRSDEVTFITKLSADGQRILYTRTFGSCIGRGIAVNAAGQAIVVGSTDFTAVPRTADAFRKDLAIG